MRIIGQTGELLNAMLGVKGLKVSVWFVLFSDAGMDIYFTNDKATTRLPFDSS